MDGICVGLISTVILLINTLPFAVSQGEGFISIDCGATEDHFDDRTNIHWTNDNAYSKIGESSTLPIGEDFFINGYHELFTVRSFPTYKKNWYEINTADNTKYLLRLMFFYENFDFKNSGKDQSMYLIIDDAIIQRINPPPEAALFKEFIITAVSDVTSVCFGRVDRDPFVNSIELRELKQAMYPLATRRTILSIKHLNAVHDDSDFLPIRYPDDKYDRFWFPWPFPDLNKTSGNRKCPENTGDEVPFAVMRNGVETDGSIKANYTIDGYEIALTFFFADFANQGDRRIHINVTYDILNDVPVTDEGVSELSSGKCNFSDITNDYTPGLKKTGFNFTVQSEIPPPLDNSSDFGEHFQRERPPRERISPSAILNAWHVSSLYYRPKKGTNTKEVAIMKKIREHFNITKWTGDPCLPRGFTWDKVKCDYDGPNVTVKSVDLSEMSLNNTVPDWFTQLTSLRRLDLSDNDLHGELPDALFENHLLKVYYSNNPNLHRKVHGLTTKQRDILIGIFVPVGIIALFVGFLVCRHIRGKTLEEYTRDTTETQGGESTKTSKWQVPWSSPIVKKDPSHGYLQ